MQNDTPSEFCRACLTETNIYFKLNHKLAEIYETFTSIRLEHDGDYLPQVVCSLCAQQLCNFSDFREQCHKTIEKLKSMFQKPKEEEELPQKWHSKSLEKDVILKEEISSDDNFDDVIGLENIIAFHDDLPVARKRSRKPKVYSSKRKKFQEEIQIDEVFKNELGIETVKCTIKSSEELPRVRRKYKKRVVSRKQKDLKLEAEKEQNEIQNSDDKCKIEIDLNALKNELGDSILSAQFIEDCEIKAENTEMKFVIDDVYICNHCQLKFKTKPILAKHVQTCTGTNMAGNHLINARNLKKKKEEALFCGICQVHCSNSAELRKHLSNHSKDSSLRCQICNYDAADFADLLVHRYKHQDPTISYSIKCFKCNLWLYVPLYLEFHYRSEHLKQPGGLCPYCKKTMVNKKNFREHLFFHTGGSKRDNTCKICNKRFTYYKTLIAHRAQHTDEKNHVCHMCGYASKSRSNLKDHVRRHTDTDPTPCEVCGKFFKGSIGLKDHQHQFHGEKNYPCPVCKKRFQAPSLMKSHLRFHSDSKPFVCSECGRAYKTKSALKAHLLTHTDSPRSCSHCAKIFPNTPALNRHLKRSLKKLCA